MEPTMRRVWLFCVCMTILQSAFVNGYEIPEVTIQAFSPKGFRASIPNAPKLSLFVFQGNINQAIRNKAVGTLAGEVVTPTDDRWIFEDPEAVLKAGDIINYYVYVSVDSAGYVKDNLSFKIAALEGERSSSECVPSVTRVRGAGVVCAGRVLLDEQFDALSHDAWEIHHYIPVYHPEFPFVSYQRMSTEPTVSVVNGHLRIAPRLQQSLPGFTNDSIYSGSLDLISGCTGQTNECSKQAWGASILPPVVSGRVTSKALAFTYGTVHIRAKLPQGDWLYPEILLEPFMKIGNLNYAAGVLRIAGARGNRNLNIGVTDYGNKVLYGGAIMNFECRTYLIHDKTSINGQNWGDDFHVYSMKWTPDSITLLVDSEEWAQTLPIDGSLAGRLPDSCREGPRELVTRSKMAPFDDYFSLTLGIAAGGITEFADALYSNGRPKPWRNQARKASLNFWQDMDSWYPTWNNAEMLVDYVKIVAL